MATTHPKNELFIKLYESTMQSDLTLTEAVVYSFLDSFTEGSDFAVTTIAERCKINERTAQRTIASLVSMGLVTVERHAGKNTRNVYYTHPVEGRQNVTPKGRQNVTPKGRQNVTPRGDKMSPQGRQIVTPRGDKMSPLPLQPPNKVETKVETKVNENPKGGGDERTAIVLEVFFENYKAKKNSEYREAKPYNVNNWKHSIVEQVEAKMRADFPHLNPMDSDDFRNWFADFLDAAWATARDFHRNRWKLQTIAEDFDELYSQFKNNTHGNHNSNNNHQPKSQPAYSEEFLRRVAAGLVG